MTHYSPRILCAAILVALVNQTALAVGDSTQVSQVYSPTPRFRSIQFDFASIYLIDAESLSGDLDLINLKMAKQLTTLGFRLGVERIDQSRDYSEPHGSPCLDYNAFARVTSSGSTSRVDIYTGYAYRRIDKGGILYSHFGSGGAIKIGFDLKWMFIPRFVGLMLKLNMIYINAKAGVSSGGLGFVIAWEQ
jgi:hypothetical protein